MNNEAFGSHLQISESIEESWRINVGGGGRCGATGDTQSQTLSPSRPHDILSTTLTVLGSAFPTTTSVSRPRWGSSNQHLSSGPPTEDMKYPKYKLKRGVVKPLLAGWRGLPPPRVDELEEARGRAVPTTRHEWQREKKKEEKFQVTYIDPD